MMMDNILKAANNPPVTPNSIIPGKSYTLIFTNKNILHTSHLDVHGEMIKNIWNELFPERAMPIDEDPNTHGSTSWEMAQEVALVGRIGTATRLDKDAFFMSELKIPCISFWNKKGQIFNELLIISFLDFIISTTSSFSSSS